MISDQEIDNLKFGNFIRHVDSRVFMVRNLRNFQMGRAQLFGCVDFKDMKDWHLDRYEIKHCFWLCTEDEIITLKVLYGESKV